MMGLSHARKRNRDDMFSRFDTIHVTDRRTDTQADGRAIAIMCVSSVLYARHDFMVHIHTSH